MNIIEEVNKILDSHQCKCYDFSSESLTLYSKLSSEEYRKNSCNHRVFAELTGFLTLHHIPFEVTSSHDIIIKSTVEF